MSTKTLLTVEEMERTPKPEEGGGYELDEGELIYVSPNSMEQGEIIYRCCRLLKDFVEAQCDCWARNVCCHPETLEKCGPILRFQSAGRAIPDAGPSNHRL